MPFDSSIKKTLVIGSGPIVIGQAAEFDYAGTQACRVLKDAGVNVVLVNSNPATIMTDNALADEIYLEPLNLKTIKRIIKKEKPDSLLAGLGGQTGLTLAMQLYEEGFLQENGVRLIGTNVEAIEKAEDRQLFKDTMSAIGEPTVPSKTCHDVDGALAIAEEIGYPVIIRPAFTLGGYGGGKANNVEELKKAAAKGLSASPISQVLIEKNLTGWKEIEFETMRDSAGNVIAVCSMENVDPVGVHTGDSIVVAPALTLSDEAFTMLKNASLNIVNALEIVGGCNCQFALDPDSLDYSVIEVNPRVSRSSALASKATGYPIAKITSKVALGYTLDEITNEIDGMPGSSFEPDCKYIVVKFPKWPFDKFAGSSRILGTAMKATGEVMSIGDSFEMAIMKAVRGAEISMDTLNLKESCGENIEEQLAIVDDHRIFRVFEAIKRGVSIDKIYEITMINPYFLEKLKNLADFEDELAKGLTDELYNKGKKYGYTDAALERISGCKAENPKKLSYKIVDTCTKAFGIETPYFYSDVDVECESRSFKRSGKPVIIVLGSGPIRIGQGIEFDYSSVHCVWTLKKLGYDVVIINNNPETVSTDYDTADRLYFEPLCEEDVMNIIEIEKPVGVVVAFGGQTAIKLTQFLDSKGIKILGTSAEGIDMAEDRERFDALLEELGMKRPKGMGVKDLKGALEAANVLGYPVLLRPSYVIGGQNMKIVHDDGEVTLYMNKILEQGIENPVLVDKYMMGTELEVDVISDGKDVLIPGIMEHIERAGVHSGDSIAVYPPYNLNDKMTKTIVKNSTKLALALGTKGLVNIQYLIYHNELYVIEVNPRASRTIPYMSKVTGIPMVDLAAKVMVGADLKDLGYGTGLYKGTPYYAVKVPVFSFEKLSDVNPYLGPEMKSTGEVLGLGSNVYEALFKGLAAAGMKIVSPLANEDTGVLISVSPYDQREVVSIAKKLDDLNFHIYADKETAASVSRLGIDVTVLENVGKNHETFSLMEEGKISYIIYTGAMLDSTYDDYMALNRKALALDIPCFSSLDTANALADIIASRYTLENTELVDINNLRTERMELTFSKMQATGDDYIFINNFDGNITCPEALCISLCDRHTGVGAYGIALIEKSDVADAKMRVFNSDGSEGQMAGNCIRNVAKYLYDNGIIKKEEMDIETRSGIRHLNLITMHNKVTMVSVDMGKAVLDTAQIPVISDKKVLIDEPVKIGGKTYNITCVSMGNPHCVVFTDNVDAVNLSEVGPLFENADIFPEKVNTEFIRVVNSGTIKMRVFERANGETYGCGTGACAAVVAAVEKGLCKKGKDITVKTRGGDLIVNYSDENVALTGNCQLVFNGSMKY